jgi:hypothetical protein
MGTILQHTRETAHSKCEYSAKYSEISIDKFHLNKCILTLQWEKFLMGKFNTKIELSEPNSITLKMKAAHSTWISEQICYTTHNNNNNNNNNTGGLSIKQHQPSKPENLMSHPRYWSLILPSPTHIHPHSLPATVHWYYIDPLKFLKHPLQVH